MSERGYNQEAIAYAQAVWLRARASVAIMLVVHFFIIIAFVEVAKNILPGNYTASAAPLVFNWWISKAIVCEYSVRKTVKRPRRLGTIASAAWILFTLLFSGCVLWYLYINS